MGTRFELVKLVLPPMHAPEVLPTVVGKLIVACWPGVIRA
ncbi:hypothetical protein R75465_07708 [Paraburkholderia aspalathi]|nr:hypothetical protein R75465_07708 [Paraburkholderia aspalathi]